MSQLPEDGEATMLTSAQCRVNAKQSLILGQSFLIPLNRPTRALSMAEKWSALAERIDREDAQHDADDPMNTAVKWINGGLKPPSKRKPTPIPIGY
jgi:hypothetical protein